MDFVLKDEHQVEGSMIHYLTILQGARDAAALSSGGGSRRQ